MPSITRMSYTKHFAWLRPQGRAPGAHAFTHRHALVALLLCACATAGPGNRGASIDFADAKGHEGTLAMWRGKVVVIDLCASWAAACNVNAKVLDEAAQALKGKQVELVTILVDEGAIGKEALRGYSETLGVTHAVVLAGPRIRAGTSALGDASYVPRIVILDADGAVRVDDSGGVVNVEGLIAKVAPLLP